MGPKLIEELALGCLIRFVTPRGNSIVVYIVVILCRMLLVKHLTKPSCMLSQVNIHPRSNHALESSHFGEHGKQPISKLNIFILCHSLFSGTPRMRPHCSV